MIESVASLWMMNLIVRFRQLSPQIVLRRLLPAANQAHKWCYHTCLLNSQSGLTKASNQERGSGLLPHSFLPYIKLKIHKKNNWYILFLLWALNFRTEEPKATTIQVMLRLTATRWTAFISWFQKILCQVWPSIILHFLHWIFDVVTSIWARHASSQLSTTTIAHLKAH